MKWIKKYWKPILVVVLLLTIFCNWRPVMHPATQEYIISSGNCRGEVNTEKYLAVSDAWAIGADEDGWAVFKRPNLALLVLKMNYQKGIWAIKRETFFVPLTPWTHQIYGTYGWQLTEANEEEYRQSHFISGFMDIYENSF